MGLLSRLLGRTAKKAWPDFGSFDDVTRLPVNATREIGAGGLPVSPSQPFRNSLRGGSDDLMEAARPKGLLSRALSETPDAGRGGAGLSRQEFLGSPRITGNRNAADLQPKALTTVADQSPQPFMQRFTLRMSPDGAAVFDGERVIASYNFGDTLVVDPAYRRQGIAEELVYQWRSAYPGPAAARERTAASQAIQERVWGRIERERAQQLPDGGA